MSTTRWKFTWSSGRSWLSCIGSRSWHGPERTGFGRSYGLARNRILGRMFKCRLSDNINRICGNIAGVFEHFSLRCKGCTGSVLFGLELLPETKVLQNLKYVRRSFANFKIGYLLTLDHILLRIIRL